MFGIWKNKLFDVIVGRRVEISVGEPWDFDSSNGENILFGVLEICKENYVILKAEDLIIKGKKYSKICAYSRYKQDRKISERLMNGDSVSANFSVNNRSGRLILLGSICII